MDFQSVTQTLGNLGEFFGAIAVFATLGYLAVQIRETRKALIRDNERSLTSDLQVVSPRVLRVGRIYSKKTPWHFTCGYGVSFPVLSTPR